MQIGEIVKNRKLKCHREGRWRKNRNLLSVGAFGLMCWIAWTWTLAFRGYCFEEQRILSDRELLLRAMQWATPRSIAFGTTDEQREKFLSRYSQCCSMDRQAHLVPFSGEKEWGFHDVVFSLEGPSNVKEEHPPFARVAVVASACGFISGPWWADQLPKTPDWYKTINNQDDLR